MHRACVWWGLEIEEFRQLAVLAFNTRIAEVGVAFQHCKFFFQFFKKHFWKKNLKKTFFHLFYSNFFNIISEKKVKIFFFHIFFSKMFFEKLNFYFSKKAKLVTFCHHLGKARVKACLDF